MISPVAVVNVSYREGEGEAAQEKKRTGVGASR